MRNKEMYIILLAIIILFLAAFAVISIRPAEFRTARTAVINASPEKVFEQVNDLHKWQAWSPWAKLDPQAKNTYQGPAAGEGASFSWAGNNQVGEGSMTITESHPCESIRFRLEFLKPFTATHSAEFKFTPEAGGTRVTWSMFGKNNFMAKLISLFIDCDKMVGTQFEQGLASIKGIVEG